jgi:hypothetical protein
MENLVANGTDDSNATLVIALAALQNATAHNQDTCDAILKGVLANHPNISDQAKALIAAKIRPA